MYRVQGDSYSFINILTNGRFRSQNKILSYASKIGKNYHIGFFTISKCHSSLNYSTLRPMYNKCHECHNRSKQMLLYRKYWDYKVRFSFILTTMPDRLGAFFFKHKFMVETSNGGELMELRHDLVATKHGY
jgi:hypothetical protein